ncbi:MAG: ABC transporter substrate-binding protein [Sphingobacteriales bacterium]|nr:ABC transporter substrate-binding protein [Sphingobacteriales bacterium]MBK6890956.1 ABC transporter substrate-binding protein [Sphingobacteriales bacterium]MBK7525993.1 ABC transporter substrate-binding protein [Sphingobacteriales bacterium]MBL0247415.1 ABC transporter substrate-binding protein [Sphingobacteriales bacterium]
MIKLKLALDWTPNVNHIGFIIAKELGFYNQKGIDLEILSPKDDNYSMTPGKKLELDIADFAIAPFETVISLNNKANQVQAVAIYAILQRDLSCIATLNSSNITSPKLLDGKTYASYKARYEDHIVKEMIKNDGGKGDLNIIYPEKLGIWNTLLSGKADSTWIFDNWEGIEASGKSIELNKFNLAEFNIPYSYSPIVLTKKENVTKQKELYSKFIIATKSGFLYAKNHLTEATEILSRYVTEYDFKNMDLEKAISFSIPHFGDESNCGIMEQERVSSFTKWLVDKGLEDKAILNQSLFTNELFE